MENNIKVAVRVRPLVKNELSEQLPVYWQIKDHTIYQIIDSKASEPIQPQSFTFDRIFNGDQGNNEIFETVVQPMVLCGLGGYNATVFTYGQTSSGKTHTMLGNHIDPGIIPQTIESIFEAIHNDPEHRFLLRVSYIDIYNNSIRDLLDECTKSINIYDDSSGTIYIKNVKETILQTPEQGHNVIKEGEKRRKYAVTNANLRSSRSHTILRIIIESSPVNDDPDLNLPVHVSHLNLVDLAGSERLSQTNATGLQLLEGNLINQSLHALTKVIRQLTSGSHFTSYRDSLLTRILKESLGGNAKTLIIGTITPASLEESVSTLQFVSQAKMIRNKAIVNKVLDSEALTKQYVEEERKLRQQLAEMKKDLEDKHSQTVTDLTKKLYQLTQRFIISNRTSSKQEERRRHTLGATTIQEETGVGNNHQPASVFKERINVQQIMALDTQGELNNAPVSVCNKDECERFKMFHSKLQNLILFELEGRIEKQESTNLVSGLWEMYVTFCNMQAELQQYKTKGAEASKQETCGQTLTLDVQTKGHGSQVALFSANKTAALKKDNFNIDESDENSSIVAEEPIDESNVEAQLTSSSYEDNDQSGIFLVNSKIDDSVTSTNGAITGIVSLLQDLRTLLCTITEEHNQTECEENQFTTEGNNEEVLIENTNCNANLVKKKNALVEEIKIENEHNIPPTNEINLLHNSFCKQNEVNENLVKKQEQLMAVLGEHINSKLKDACSDYTVKITEQERTNAALLEQCHTFQSKLLKLFDDNKQLAADITFIESKFAEETKKNCDLTREKFELTCKIIELETLNKSLTDKTSKLLSAAAKCERNNAISADTVKVFQSNLHNEMNLNAKLTENKNILQEKITEQEYLNKLLQNDVAELVQVNATVIKESDALQSEIAQQQEFNSKIIEEIKLLRDKCAGGNIANMDLEKQKQSVLFAISEEKKQSLSIQQELMVLQRKLAEEREETIQATAKKTKLETNAELNQEATKLELIKKKQKTIKKNITNSVDDNTTNESRTFHFKNKKNSYQDEVSSSEDCSNNNHLQWKIGIQRLQGEVEQLDNEIVIMSMYMMDLEKVVRQKSKQIDQVKSQHDPIVEVKRRRSAAHDSSRDLEWLKEDKEEEDELLRCPRCNIFNSTELHRALNRELRRKNMELAKLQNHLKTTQLDLSVTTANSEEMSEHIKHLDEIINTQQKQLGQKSKKIQDFKRHLSGLLEHMSHK